jgi:hypothetical protein
MFSQKITKFTLRQSRNQKPEISQQGNKDGLVHSKIAKAAKADFRKFKGPVFATFVALLRNIFSSWLCELVVNYFVFAKT